MNKLTSCGIAGDWHIDTLWALMALERYAQESITEIIHVGDFGFWPGDMGDHYLTMLEQELARNGQTLYVTPGNHEDYVRLGTYQPHPTTPGYSYSPEQPHILVASRGARWSWGGVSFVSLGGAASIDFENRVEGISWWPQERITMGDVYHTIAGGTADVFISHDAAQGVPLFGSHRTNEHRWSEAGLAYANQSRDSIRAACNVVKPKLALHGHYHIFKDQAVTLEDGAGEKYTYRNVSLDMNGKANNLAVLDLATLSLRMLSMPGEGDGMVTVAWDEITE